MRTAHGALLFLMISALLFSPSAVSDAGDVEVRGIPEDGRFVNPLNATVIYEDPGGDQATVSWILDGELVEEGYHIQRYIYPGKHNLTVRIENGNSTVIERYFLLDPIPPPGWGEEPDRKGNELLFWSVFGAGALIFAAAAAWIWLRKAE